MDEVSTRYDPSDKSFAIKYGGMAYPGEGAPLLLMSNIAPLISILRPKI
jgi:hypothetical protein